MTNLLRALITLALAWWLSGLWLPPTGTDVDRQLVYLEDRLDRGAAAEMQALFPEGYVFTWTLYGLAHVEQAERCPEPHHLDEARRALAAVDSDEGRAVFSPHLDPPFGVFYVGWTTLLRAEIARVAGVDDPRLSTDRAALRDAFARAGTPFLQSYSGRAWPADSVVAVAALGDPPPGWVDAVRTRLDPETGLIPHDAAYTTARGSSSALMQVFLPAIDADLAADQYARFKQRFVVQRLGLYGVREWTTDALAERESEQELLDLGLYGDVDSGPLVWGLSLSASTVAIGAAHRNGDEPLAAALGHAAEMAGFPVGVSGKRYALGLLPVGDAFLAWAKAAPPAATTSPAAGVAWFWRAPAVILGLVLWSPVWLTRRRR